MSLRRAARMMATVVCSCISQLCFLQCSVCSCIYQLAVVFLNCISCSAVQCLLLGLICRNVGAAWMDNGKKCQAGNLSLYNSNVRSDLIGMNYVVKS